MQNVTNEVQSALSRCSLMINGDIVSQEPILQDQWKYLCELAKKEGNIGAVLHTGSNAYNAMILFFCIDDLMNDADRRKDMLVNAGRLVIEIIAKYAVGGK